MSQSKPTPRHARAAALAALVALALPACGERSELPPAGACTLVGCQSALNIAVRDASQSYVTEISGELTAGGETIPFACPATTTKGYTCSSKGVSFLVKLSVGEQVKLKVTATATGESWSGGLTPDVTLDRPNGPGCPPVCSAASATVTVGP